MSGGWPRVPTEAMGWTVGTRGTLHLRQAPRSCRLKLDAVVAIGELYRFDRFAVPARLGEELQARFPDLLISV